MCAFMPSQRELDRAGCRGRLAAFEQRPPGPPAHSQGIPGAARGGRRSRDSRNHVEPLEEDRIAEGARVHHDALRTERGDLEGTGD